MQVIIHLYPISTYQVKSSSFFQEESDASHAHNLLPGPASKQTNLLPAEILERGTARRNRTVLPNVAYTAELRGNNKISLLLCCGMLYLVQTTVTIQRLVAYCRHDASKTTTVLYCTMQRLDTSFLLLLLLLLPIMADSHQN